jgi:penicillin-binding protein 2
MTFMNRSPKSVRFALILFVLIAFPFSITSFAKRRHGGGGRHAGKSSRHSSARERRAGRRGRQSARGRGRSSRRLSAREIRAERSRIAREQSSSLKALERRLRRPLTKRERAAEMRRIEGRHGRALAAARRRAEAARRAAIARQRALDQAARNEAQSFIAKDDPTGEDPEVRRVAMNALGNHAGTVVVMDPKTGRVYSIVNQEWGVRRGFKPCSTIKLVTGLAGLNEKVIIPSDTTTVSDKYHIDLTDALAYSNNTYFQQVGGQVGFEKMMAYARELGLGSKTGINAPNEFAGQLPYLKSGYAVNHMSSHGDDFAVTPIQLATLVSSMANGGKLLVPRIPKTPEDAKTRVRSQINIEPDSWQRMVPGMVGSVNYGSGKRAYDPLQTVAGKTGTCKEDGNWVGLFASYAPLINPKLAVVVIARRADGRGHFPAAVAGQIYRDLNHRFGTPTFMPIAQEANGSGATDEKAAVLNEEQKEQKEADEAEAKEQEGDNVDVSLMDDEAAAAATKKGGANAKPTNKQVKPVMMQVPKREEPAKPASGSKASKKAPAPDDRPRRVNGDQP